MAATGRGDWRSARSSEALPPHLGYSRSYDHPPPAPASSYYGDSLPPSHSWGPGGSSPYHPHSSYGRAGGPPPPHYHYPPPQHQQHSPIASRDRDPDPYWDGPLSPTPSGAYDRTQPLPPYSGSTTPYRGSTASSRPRSQVIHRGSPFSSRGGGSAAARSFDRQFFPDSPYRNHRPPPGTMTTRIVLPMHRQHLPLSRNALPPAWEPPSPLEVPTKRGSHDEEDDDDDDDYVASTVNREPKAQDGSDNDEDTDPLAILAKVSSDMDSTKVKSKKTDDEEDEERGDGDQAEGGLTRAKSTEPPTSPLTRRTRSSPVITPTTDNTTNKQSKTEVSVDPSFPDVPQPPAAAAAAAKAAVAPAPAVAPSVNPPPNAEAAAAAAPLPAAGKGTPKSVTPMPAYYPPPYGEDPHGPPAHHHHHPYNASSARAPSAGYRPYAPPPANQTVHHRRAPSWGPEVHPAVVERHSFDSFDSAASAHDSPSLPPPASRRGYYPYATNPHGPPAQHYPPPRYYGAPPASSDPYHQRPPYPYPPQHASSHMDEKTVLRRKFSWKHYPELERFLIANRDEYLEHSSKNYTAEQKQFNNWLTEQLIQVAERHGYIFDPEEFNFVAIRDRIRCYYKSYVQTARKRGLELPGQAHIKKQRPANSLDKYAEEKDRKAREEAEQRRREAESGKKDRDSGAKDESTTSGESKEAESTKENAESVVAAKVEAVEAK